MTFYVTLLGIIERCVVLVFYMYFSLLIVNELFSDCSSSISETSHILDHRE